MAEIYRLNAISAFVEHRAADELIVASLEWPMEQPDKTYTIDINPLLSFQLDETVPIRPCRINLRDDEPAAAQAHLQELVGAELTEAMLRAPVIGACALQLTLSPEQSIAIALIQVRSPSTPPHIRRGCIGKIIEITRHPPTASEVA